MLADVLSMKRIYKDIFVFNFCNLELLKFKSILKVYVLYDTVCVLTKEGRKEGKKRNSGEHFHNLSLTINPL